jgi:hypothetical protein
VKVIESGLALAGEAQMLNAKIETSAPMVFLGLINVSLPFSTRVINASSLCLFRIDHGSASR